MTEQKNNTKEPKQTRELEHAKSFCYAAVYDSLAKNACQQVCGTFETYSSTIGLSF